ncbi:hypothetical protein GQ53DRAFT_842266 [Thozetella sp. PMI_491]|nr:hypothetical protein GQ53DRAFT_842266 [Thozetella sp. PMI_491]
MHLFPVYYPCSQCPFYRPTQCSPPNYDPTETNSACPAPLHNTATGSRCRKTKSQSLTRPGCLCGISPVLVPRKAAKIESSMVALELAAIAPRWNSTTIRVKLGAATASPTRVRPMPLVTIAPTLELDLYKRQDPSDPAVQISSLSSALAVAIANSQSVAASVDGIRSSAESSARAAGASAASVGASAASVAASAVNMVSSMREAIATVSASASSAVAAANSTAALAAAQVASANVAIAAANATASMAGVQLASANEAIAAAARATSSASAQVDAANNAAAQASQSAVSAVASAQMDALVSISVAMSLAMAASQAAAGNGAPAQATMLIESACRPAALPTTVIIAITVGVVVFAVLVILGLYITVRYRRARSTDSFRSIAKRTEPGSEIEVLNTSPSGVIGQTVGYARSLL